MDSQSVKNIAYQVEILGDIDALHGAVTKNLKLTAKYYNMTVVSSRIVENSSEIELDYGGVKIPAPLAVTSIDPLIQRQVIVGAWARSAVTGVVQVRGGKGSRILDQVSVEEVKDVKGKFAVGVSAAPFLPALSALIVAGVGPLLAAVVRLVFGETPGFDWELREAHGRLCSDHLLAGPDFVVSLVRSRGTDGNAHVGYGTRQGHEPVEEFAEGEVVA